MNILDNQQKSHSTWQKPVTKLALTDLNHRSFNLIQLTPVKQNLVSETPIIFSNDELVIAIEPEIVVIMGYAEFSDNLEIYSNF
ncbi:MAG: hypothetical protein ACRC06_11055 [Waterburya sp.]